MAVTLQNIIYRVRVRLSEPATPTLPNPPTTPPVARAFTDTELTEYINDGLRDIARRAEDLHTYDSTISIPAYAQSGTSPIPTYPLSLGPQPSVASIPQVAPTPTVDSDILRITRVEFQILNASNMVYPLEWQPQSYLDNIWSINQTSTMSYPAYWTTRGFPGGSGRSAFVIQIFPQPSQAGNLNIFYYRQPVRIPDPVANASAYLTPIDLIAGWDDLLIDYVHFNCLIRLSNPLWEKIQQLYETKISNLIEQTRHISDQAQYFQYDAGLWPWAVDDWSY